ncbi:hypothetical protein KW843_22910 [Acidovorax sp. sif1233]|uniref:hypothetical protein n=1 Tax=Acidovorax sp. sif1233 TaxID=2854792 RepID=UPI001C44AD44|nr:hypothetical protein [Acidovorax sp. sif1233]MBV7457349.1 hypothetical protein [Acidovorax sp. sif1233]
MKHCAGPCQQGRLPCPNPTDCESDDIELTHLQSLCLLAALLLTFAAVLGFAAAFIPFLR